MYEIPGSYEKGKYSQAKIFNVEIIQHWQMLWKLKERLYYL